MLTIAALGTPKTYGCASKETVLKADRLFFQTLRNPCMDWAAALRPDGIAMDDLYEGTEDFTQLHRAIAERLLEEPERDVVFAVPGRGIEGTELLKHIIEAADKLDVRVLRIPGVGYAQAAIANCPMLAGECGVCTAAALADRRIDVTLPLAVEEFDAKLLAGEVKLYLLEYYPDDWPVYLASMAGDGTYSYRQIALYELDRCEGISIATVLVVPPAQQLERLSRHGLRQLEELTARLRAPGGCPWDAKQTHQSLQDALIEETYEVIDAIKREDDDALAEELGDLLLQIVFHAVIGEERQRFTMRDVCTGIVNKLIYRHPHVFKDTSVRDANEVLVNWEKLKKTEKSFHTQTDVLRAVPMNFPALLRSYKVQKKAADVGFDWEHPGDALKKVVEEAQEVQDALNSGSGLDEELGDLLFAVVNVVRLSGRKPEPILNAATDKFICRFEQMEKLAAHQNLNLEQMTLDEMDRLWNLAKISPFSGKKS
ncbi:MAG: nucleoside triphosphate pyrophosphohydrolase [Bacillota bacterium]